MIFTHTKSLKFLKIDTNLPYYFPIGYVRKYYLKNRIFLRNLCTIFAISMRNSYFLTSQNISNAKIAHLAWKICAFFRGFLTLSLFSDNETCTQLSILHGITCELTLAKLVDLPTPLTPQKVMVKGRPWERASMASRRMSSRRLGDRTFMQASCRS